MKININGVNYYYEWYSEYQANRPTLVCLHGFTGTSQTFASLFKQTAEINILGIDLIGHGKTDCHVHPYRYQLSCLCQDLVLLIQKLGITQFSLLGYSMGARVALGLVCLFPNHVNHLILESGSPGLNTQIDRANRKRADERLAGYIMNHPIESFVDKWEQLPLFDTQKELPSYVQGAIRHERSSQQRFGLALSLWFMGTGVQPSFWMDLAKITIPVQLIVGERDIKFRQIAKDMQKKQPNVLIETIKGAGHCIHLERPEQFRECCLEFLNVRR